MNDDTPNYSRNSDRRQMVLLVVCIFSFLVTLATTGVGMRELIGNRTDMEPGFRTSSIVGTAVLSGFLATALAGFAIDRIHRSIWPERPDDAP